MTVVREASITTDMARDSALALTLATHGTATGPTADELRRRLRGYIGLLADPAQEYADALSDGRARNIAQHTVQHARAVAEDEGQDPAASLRLLAKSVELLMRYTADQQRRRPR